MNALTESVDALVAAWDKPDSPGCVVRIVHTGALIHARGFEEKCRGT